MRLFKLPFAGALALAVLAAGVTAQAQTKAEDIFYEFTDDDLIGDTLGTTGAQINVRPPAARVTLIRPRASFVPEMLKSVEHM
jgi:hypothetical protein